MTLDSRDGEAEPHEPAVDEESPESHVLTEVFAEFVDSDPTRGLITVSARCDVPLRVHANGTSVTTRAAENVTTAFVPFVGFSDPSNLLPVRIEVAFFAAGEGDDGPRPPIDEFEWFVVPTVPYSILSPSEHAAYLAELVQGDQSPMPPHEVAAVVAAISSDPLVGAPVVLAGINQAGPASSEESAYD